MVPGLVPLTQADAVPDGRRPHPLVGPGHLWRELGRLSADRVRSRRSPWCGIDRVDRSRRLLLGHALLLWPTPAGGTTPVTYCRGAAASRRTREWRRSRHLVDRCLMTNPASILVERERVSLIPTETGVDMVIHLDCVGSRPPGAGYAVRRLRWLSPVNRRRSPSSTRPSAPALARDARGRRRDLVSVAGDTNDARCDNFPPASRSSAKRPLLPSRGPPSAATMPRPGAARRLRLAAWARALLSRPRPAIWVPQRLPDREGPAAPRPRDHSMPWSTRPSRCEARVSPR